MLEQATGRPTWQWSQSGPQPSSTTNPFRARIEQVGQFRVLGEQHVRREGGATIVNRRIAAALRSGLPIEGQDIPLLLRYLIADAKALGGSRLRLAVEFVEDPADIFFESLAATFGGSVKKFGSVYMLDIRVDSFAR